jgi:hypothetical protein
MRNQGLYASQFTELFYASGSSTIESTGNFTLARSGNRVTISGSVTAQWYNPYDWLAGLNAPILGFGNISDDDALLLQEHRGAAPFYMEATWSQNLNGRVVMRNYWFDTQRFNWSSPIVSTLSAFPGINWRNAVAIPI